MPLDGGHNCADLLPSAIFDGVPVGSENVVWSSWETAETETTRVCLRVLVVLLLPLLHRLGAPTHLGYRTAKLAIYIMEHRTRRQ